MNNYGFFRVAAASPVVKLADVKSNKEEICSLVDRAEAQGVSALVFPELSLTGAGCGDLFQQTSILDAVEQALDGIKCHTRGKLICVVVGAPLRYNDRLYDCAVVFRNGQIKGVVPKILIPSTGDQTQSRWFCSGAHFLGGGNVVCGGSYTGAASGSSFNASVTSGVAMISIAGGVPAPIHPHQIFTVGGVSFAVGFGDELSAGASPTGFLAQAGAQIILQLSAGNDYMHTHSRRKMLLSARSWQDHAAYVYCGAGHGESTQDTVCSGDALIYEAGELVAASKRFQIHSDLVLADVDADKLKGLRLKNQVGAASNYISGACGSDGYGVSGYSDGGFGVNGHGAGWGNLDILKQDLGAAVETDFEQQFHGLLDPMPFIPKDDGSVAEEAVELQVAGLVSRLEHIGQPKVVVGVSGGLDSTLALLVCVLAFDRLGWDRKGIIGVTMPGFGTSGRTYKNALDFMTCLGIEQKEVSIVPAVTQHFNDIGQDIHTHDVTYENSQARERTQILMDYANKVGGIVLGTGDLSELALGWATYNGDHMSMYGINASVPKTLVRHLVAWVAAHCFLDAQVNGRTIAVILKDVIDTPVSPELTPTSDEGQIAQKTEDIVGPYELHDFFLYNYYHYGSGPAKIYFLARKAFDGKEGRPHYDEAVIKKFLKKFYWRFFTQQFKRSCLPDGPKVTEVSLSPRGGYVMPSDAKVRLFIDELDQL